MQGERLDEGATAEADFGVLTVVSRDLTLGEIGGEALLKRAEDATLLEGGGEIRFRHQLLQEYFTASALRSQIQDAPPLLAAALWPAQRWWERSGWEEAAVLLAGLYSDDCAPVLRWLEDAQPEVCAQCVLESGAAIADREALFRELHDAWLPRLTDVDREPLPEARAAIGRALGRLGLDDRRGVGLDANGLPEIDWATIPGGEFIYQDGERRRLDGFRIARYPVTNAQFRAFLEADDGYRDERWWRGLTEPFRHPEQPRWDIANNPRETVSWSEAMALCAWLSHKTGLAVRLPTEWEWERAARGTDGRTYPWGNDYEQGMANISETFGDAGHHDLGRTSAVGIYPLSVSPDGVLDLSGNLWEWCLNEFSHPERIQTGGDMSRVVRGGSWDDDHDIARADHRSRYFHRLRDDYYGFRVLCASPIRSALIRWSLNAGFAVLCTARSAVTRRFPKAPRSRPLADLRRSGGIGISEYSVDGIGAQHPLRPGIELLGGGPGHLLPGRIIDDAEAPCDQPQQQGLRVGSRSFGGALLKASFNPSRNASLDALHNPSLQSDAVGRQLFDLDFKHLLLLRNAILKVAIGG